MTGSPKPKASRRKAPGSSWDLARRFALALPGVEEGSCYGTPGLRVKGKFMARLWEDGETLVVKLDFDRKELLLAAEPDVFFTTDHYRGYPSVLVRLSKIDPDALRGLLEDAWRIAAPKRLLAAHGI
ncbi:MAG TPA: MmcQ/YjbR family DNA-binding protein [Thermoanaerobaculia bacterium]|nr:MmcQ/YjbR family DNA-binding protein [Thermoanaerobaculia bacterium]